MATVWQMDFGQGRVEAVRLLQGIRKLLKKFKREMMVALVRVVMLEVGRYGWVLSIV